MRATERGSHLGRTTRNGRSLEGSGYLDAVNDSGVQLIYKTRANARQPWIAGGFGQRNTVVFCGFSKAKK
ncbi:hypothetical protein D3C76_1293820 [compost metagenome]